MQRKLLEKKALSSWKNYSHKSTLAMCTGSGKSRIGILACEMFDSSKAKFCLVVPTVKLRDTNWDNEFIKWKKSTLLKKFEKHCYASISKIKGKHYNCVILDEVHNLTENNIKFLKNNTFDAIIGLTATPPEDEVKANILNKYCPVSFTLSLEEGVEMGIVAPYDIKVVETRLDDNKKNIRAGKAPNYYMVTERYRYNQLSSIIRKIMYAKKDAMWAIMQRMRFIKDLPSKTEAAKYILKHIIPPDYRTLIFCGSIKQAEELCENYYHSKSGDENLNDFIEMKINRLSCVEALNEGHNLPLVDAALIVQLNSNKKDLVQRVNTCAVA